MVSHELDEGHEGKKDTFITIGSSSAGAVKAGATNHVVAVMTVEVNAMPLMSAGW